MKIISYIFLGLFSLALMGCNTVHGFGKDVQNVGETISDSMDGGDS